MFPEALKYIERAIKASSPRIGGFVIETRESPESQESLASQLAEKGIQVRYRPNTATSIIMNEQMALLFLPTVDKRIDLQAAILLKGECQINWCSRLFDWFWETSVLTSAHLNKAY